jgi:AraC-like DNA-binding protein
MRRKELLSVPSGLVEDGSGIIAERRPSAEDFSPEFQIALPYRGVFRWYVGRDDVVGDANQVLFITGGEAFRVTGPRPGRYAELILTPVFSVLSELIETTGFDHRDHPLFRARSCRATPAVQQAAARLLHWATADGISDMFAAEEAMVELLRTALKVEPSRVVPSAATRRLIQRTKEYLGMAFAGPLLLGDIADAVGTRPTYLTDVFARFEGVSLHRYVTQLRLARALVELPGEDDLTRLALDLGFSSHSHFTLAFRRAFGCTPSQFRSTTGRSRSQRNRENQFHRTVLSRQNRDIVM